MNSKLDRRWILGIGSHHGWDRVGWLIAERLKNRVAAEVRLITSPIQVMDIVEECDELILIDACRIQVAEDSSEVESTPANSTGRIAHRWQWPDPAILTTEFSGTHDLGVAAVLGLAEQLQMLPKKAILWGIDIAPYLAMNHPHSHKTANFEDQLIEPTVEQATIEILENLRTTHVA